jgi:Flp pilus assembly protein TadG
MRRGEEGSTVVEAVLLVPVLMVVLLLVIQCALWAHAAQVVQLAASEGDQVARSQGGGTGAGAAEARSVTDGPGSDLQTASVAVDVMADDVARVTVTGRALSIVPGLSLHVTSVEIGPIQEFRGSE